MAKLPKTVNKKLMFYVDTQYMDIGTEQIFANSISCVDYDISSSEYHKYAVIIKELDITVEIGGEIDLAEGKLKSLEKREFELLKALELIRQEKAELTALPSPESIEEVL